MIVIKLNKRYVLNQVKAPSLIMAGHPLTKKQPLFHHVPL